MKDKFNFSKKSRKYVEHKNSTEDLAIACIHVLDGGSVYHQTKGLLLCRKCFRYYNSFRTDENGHWKIPQGEKFDNLKTVCRSCVDGLINK